jgi:hypothetical protein
MAMSDRERVVTKCAQPELAKRYRVNSSVTIAGHAGFEGCQQNARAATGPRTAWVWIMALISACIRSSEYYLR